MLRIVVLLAQFVFICTVGALANAALRHMGWDFTLGMFTAIVILQICSYVNKGHLLDLL